MIAKEKLTLTSDYAAYAANSLVCFCHEIKLATSLLRP